MSFQLLAPLPFTLGAIRASRWLLLVGLVLLGVVLQPPVAIAAAAQNGNFLPVPANGCDGNARIRYGAPKQIPGTNLMGWRGEATLLKNGAFVLNPTPHQVTKIKKVVEPETDDQGNIFEVWCIELVGGAGNSFGYRYTPKGKPAVWVGRCAFTGGINVPKKEPSGDTDKNGNDDSWTKITHTSKDDSGGGANDPNDDDKKPGKKDYDWEYDTATGNLKRWETNNGVRLHPADPEFNGPAPTDFSDLLASTPPNPDQDAPMLSGAPVNVRLVQNTGHLWNFALSGSPFADLSTEVFAGDSWSMSVSGIEDVLSPANWTAAFAGDYVTWTYADFTTVLNITDQPVYGFNLVLSEPFRFGEWISDSADNERANFGWASVVANTAPEPSPLALIGSALVLMSVAARRRRRGADAGFH